MTRIIVRGKSGNTTVLHPVKCDWSCPSSSGLWRYIFLTGREPSWSTLCIAACPERLWKGTSWSWEWTTLSWRTLGAPGEPGTSTLQLASHRRVHIECKNGSYILETLLCLFFLILLSFSRPGCSMPEIWDVEDPQNVGKVPLCNHMSRNSRPHFNTVFSNDIYKVLKVPKVSKDLR